MEISTIWIVSNLDRSFISELQYIRLILDPCMDIGSIQMDISTIWMDISEHSVAKGLIVEHRVSCNLPVVR